MIIYREQKRILRTADVLESPRTSDADARRELLIAFGELECGVADLLPPGYPAVANLRRAALEIGRAFVDPSRPLPDLRFDLPPSVEVGVPEGYAYYGLFPETYVDATEKFFADARPRKCTVIGIRSIGTSLSAAVAGALLEQGVEVESFTVRPTGHPFHRITHLGQPVDPGAFHLVVDEGPGLSGSSLGSVAEALHSAGVPDSHVIFFPSWQADPATLSSPMARDHFRRHRSYVGNFDLGFDPWIDLSAGQWRAFLGSPEIAVHPQHERRKFLSPDRKVLAKFAGFGSRGRQAFDRARILHEAGFTPSPLNLSRGFLFTEFVPGCPMWGQHPAGVPAPHLATYLNYIRNNFRSPIPVPWNALAEMLSTNLDEALHIDASPLLRVRPLIEDAPTHHLDGRMLPHEWIKTPSGILKADAVDHADDHFFPGPQDIAWDVAATIVEFALPDDFLRFFDTATRRRVPFYLIAYSVFRLAYCRMAESSAPAEAERFRALARRYETVIRASPLLRISSD